MKAKIQLISLSIIFGTQLLNSKVSPEIFYPHTFTHDEKINVDPKKLADVALDVSDFLRTFHQNKSLKIDIGYLCKDLGITIEDVQKTAAFIAETGEKKPKLLSSPWFYKTHFDFYHWHTDRTVCKARMGWFRPIYDGDFPWPHSVKHPVRITNYRVLTIPASHKKTKEFRHPLYSTPSDQKSNDSAYLKENQEKLVRFKFSKTEILNGALDDHPHGNPIAWVTEKGFGEIMLQGSSYLHFSNKEKNMLVGVTVHNGKESSERYWFFERKPIKKRSPNYPTKVFPTADVSFAGDLEALGFGKLFAYVGKNPASLQTEMRIGALVDTGSAFKGNHCQLDLFLGNFSNEQLFREHANQFPYTADIYLMIKKRTT